MLAYSSVAQAGYILLGLTAVVSGDSVDVTTLSMNGLNGLLIYLLGYHAWMLGFLVTGGLFWIGYTGWVCTRLERAYHRYLREAEENPEITLADFNRRRRR